MALSGLPVARRGLADIHWSLGGQAESASPSFFLHRVRRGASIDLPEYFPFFSLLTFP